MYEIIKWQYLVINVSQLYKVITMNLSLRLIFVDQSPSSCTLLFDIKYCIDVILLYWVLQLNDYFAIIKHHLSFGRYIKTLCKYILIFINSMNVISGIMYVLLISSKIMNNSSTILEEYAYKKVLGKRVYDLLFKRHSKGSYSV